MVVRNRCPETGNEEYLVSAAVFAVRYEGPIPGEVADGWKQYRPRGVEMRFVRVLRAKMRSPFWPLGEKKW